MKLVQDGKLSPEDAAELIEAFAEKPQDPAPDSNTSPAESAFSRVIGSIESLTREVSKSVDWQDVSKQIRDSVQKGVDAVKHASEEASKGRGWAMFGQVATSRSELPLNLKSGDTLKLECHSAEIHVEGGHECGSITIEATFRAFTEAEAQAAADAFTPVIEEGEGFVGFRHMGQEMAHAEIIAKVPAGTVVEVKVASGDTFVERTQAGVTIHSTSGDATVSGATGKVELTSVSGDVTVTDSPASLVTAESKSGDVTIRAATGIRSARSTSGDIKLEEVGGTNFSAESSSGDIRVVLTSPATGAVNVRTVSGSIEIETPDGGDARVALSSVSGTVDVDGLELTDRAGDDKRVTGKLGSGNGTLDASSVSGDVSLGLRSATVVG